MTNPQPIAILVVDDDDDDRLLIKEALEEARLENKVDFAVDGREALDYLQCVGNFSNRAGEELPGLILMDLNMPRMGGREAIMEIKKNPDLRHIPIIVLTTSTDEEDVFKSYDIGVNSFISKPIAFASFIQKITDLGHYWFQVVKLPRK